MEGRASVNKDRAVLQQQACESMLQARGQKGKGGKLASCPDFRPAAGFLHTGDMNLVYDGQGSQWLSPGEGCLLPEQALLRASVKPLWEGGSDPRTWRFPLCIDGTQPVLVPPSIVPAVSPKSEGWAWGIPKEPQLALTNIFQAQTCLARERLTCSWVSLRSFLCIPPFFLLRNIRKG